MNRTFLKAFETVQKNLYVPLLIFLLLFTVDKIVLKIAGILLIYLLHPDLRFRGSLKKIPLFYLLVILLEMLKFLLLNQDFSWGRSVMFLVGCMFWIVSFLSLYQFRQITDGIDEKKLFNTLCTFFLINAGISILDLLIAMYHSGSLNPYRLADAEFGTSTGDLIKGIFLGPSYINMMINSFFIFFFLYRGRIKLAFAAMFVALLTTTNFANLVLLPVLGACFFFNKERKVKLSIAAFFCMFVVFYMFASPSNFRYLKDSIFVPKKQQQELVAYEKKALIKEIKDSLRRDTTMKARLLLKKMAYSPGEVNDLLLQHAGIADSQVTLTGKFGKVQAFKETAHYLATNPKTFTFGAGMGGFSSFLALRMSDINKAEGSRLFTHLPSYVSPDFRKNHYQIFKTLYSLPREFHSAKHFPNSFVNQLFGEYGLAGVLLFLFTYVLFFVKYFRRLTYGKYLLFLLGGFLLFDYLFEYLSVVAIFELLMLKDIGRVEEKKNPKEEAHIQALSL